MDKYSICRYLEAKVIELELKNHIWNIYEISLDGSWEESTHSKGLSSGYLKNDCPTGVFVGKFSAEIGMFTVALTRLNLLSIEDD